MPPLKSTRLQHIHAILAGKKKVLMQNQCKGRDVPNWPELAVKLIYPMAMEQLPEVHDYMPDPVGDKELRFPDREFFYRVLYALHPEETDRLIDHAARQRMPNGQNLNDRQWQIDVQPEWIDNLLRYEY